MRDIVFLSVQPDQQYFHWQVEVFINNAMKVGVDPKQIFPIFVGGEPSEGLKILRTLYPEIEFPIYPRSERKNFGYIPLIRPQALAAHFRAHPELKDSAVFYHDSDIIFRELPDFQSLNLDETWYVSDTISYLGANYIKSKSDSLLTDMCTIAKIPRSLVEQNELNSGGAQYFMKNLNAEFWDEVERISVELYRFLSFREAKERINLSEDQLKTYNPIQKWCADMWAVFWTGLKLGHRIRISKELDFSWGSGGGHEWEKSKIMHNAGVVSSEGGKKFYKGEFINQSPFDYDFSQIDRSANTWNYVQAILEAKEKRFTRIPKTNI